MFYVKINGQEKKVFFSHGREEKTVVQKDGNEVVQTHPANTTCKITQNDEVIGEGQAVCSAKDRFEYEAGRKIALTRALINAGLTSSERKKVWQTYLSK